MFGTKSCQADMSNALAIFSSVDRLGSTSPFLRREMDPVPSPVFRASLGLLFKSEWLAMRAIRLAPNTLAVDEAVDSSSFAPLFCGMGEA